MLLLSSVVTAAALASTTFGTDPTETLTRVEVTFDQSELRRDAMRTALKTRFDLGIVDVLALRAEMPFARLDPSDGSAETGGGDARVQLGWRAFDDPSFSMFFAGGVVLNTANDRVLGQGADQVVLQASASAALPGIRSRLFETIEHFVSYDRDRDRDGVALTKIDLHLMTEWSQTAWTQSGAEFFIDWKRGDQTGLNLDFEIGKQTNSGFAIWLKPAVGLFGHDIEGVVDWSVTVGVRWLF
ncbi:MAG: hypothetical protein JNL28_12145 [Planctomycetes bacterium]|nr:hypothetical protein [Planctomycetota bacterium]